jgi:hypothetical protein
MLSSASLIFDYMALTHILWNWDTLKPMPIVQAPNGPYPVNSTPIAQGVIVDPFGVPIPAADISVLTLTIFDTLTQTIINNVSNVDILNTGRGTVDSAGLLTIKFEAADLNMDETPGVLELQRSFVVSWTYSNVSSAGSSSAQVNFPIVNFPVQ